MNFVRSLSSTRIVWSAAALVLSGSAAGIAQAPVGLDVQDSQKALQFLSQSNFAEAAKLYESIPTNYPTSPLIPEANFRLGYIGYVTGDYDRGLSALQKNVTGKNVPPDILELSYSYIPQISAAKAGKLQANDPGRKEAFQAAIKEFDTFIQKFPQSEEVEAANYGKARALYSIEQYEGAAVALRANMQKFPQSPSIMDSQFMLAVVLGTLANTSLQHATAPDPAAETAYQDATKLLGDIIGKRTDIALANDAQFQLGEMLFLHGNFEKKEAREPLLRRALDAYRAVLPKELIVKAQQARITAIGVAKTDALRRQDVGQFKKLQRYLEKEQEKTASIEQRGDQTLTARIKCAQIFLALERYDETRVLMRYLEPQVQSEEDKKQVAYFTALTYAAQNLTDKAVETYDKFMAQYKGDPIGENLPLLVGAAFLAHGESEKAIKYFNEQAELYPKSNATAGAAMRQGLALVDMGRFDEGRAALVKFLETNPTKEQAAGAELGIATIDQKTGKAADALKGFTSVRDKYPGSNEAEQAGFWVGRMTLDKGDAKGALTEMKAFLAKSPKSDLAPAALLSMAQAQASLSDKAGAIATYKELAAQFPESRPAVSGYFQRAALHQKDNELDQVTAVMTEFIASHPKSEELFSAFDYIGQVQVSQKKVKEAIATYEDFVVKNAESPSAPKALLKSGGLWKKYGEDQGPYLTLDPARREEWTKGLDNAVRSYEQVLEKYPESNDVSLALQGLLACQKVMLRVKLKTPAAVEEYFQGFAKKFDAKPETRSKILFALAAYLAEKDEKKAVEIMKGAYDDKLVYAPADLDLYGSALIKAKQYEPAFAVFNKLAADYPIPANTPPEKLPRGAVSDAQSMALFGFAKILQDQGKKEQAGKKFEELEKNFPGSPKLFEAAFGRAEADFQSKRYDEALGRLQPVT
ncbi:MAG: repeat-containing protein, partial [Chthoniobacteraceae bacterium]|nr:repeat-containing protein [Chthoniobacteraceae bacterium]